MELNSRNIESIIKGINAIGEAVTSTLGPNGNTVIINTPQGIKVTKDGATVAHHIHSEDPFEEIGINLIREACKQANSISGDGSTTTTLLTWKFIEKYFNYDSKKERNNYISLLQELQKDIYKLSEHVNEASIKDVYDIAYVSTNGSSMIANILYNLFEKYGKNLKLNLEFSNTGKSYVEAKNGFVLNTLPTSKYFIDPTGQSYKGKKEYIIIPILNKVYDINTLKPYLESYKGNPILFIVHDVEQKVVDILLNNYMSKRIDVNILKYPISGEFKKDTFEDLMLVAGSTTSSLKPLLCSLDSSELIIEMPEDPKIQERIEGIQKAISETHETSSKYNLERRLQNLTSSICTYYIGGETDFIAGELKDRIEDAYNAVKGALEEGYVYGGGITLELFSKAMHKDIKEVLCTPINILQPSDKDYTMWSKYIKEKHIYDSARSLRLALETSVATALSVIKSNFVIDNATMY